MSMSLLSPEKTTVPDSQQEQVPAKRLLEKTLGKRLFETKSAIFDVLGWPLKGPLSLLSWTRKQVSRCLPWLQSLQKAPPTAEPIPQPIAPEVLAPEEKAHQNQIVSRFRDLYDGFRRSHHLEALQMSMNDLADEVALQQVQHQEVRHSSAETLHQKGIGAEIITAGFSSPEEALENFIRSPQHARALMSPSYSKMGIALRQGQMIKRDEQGQPISSQPVYYLVVVYDQDGKPLEEGQDVPEGPIPDDRRPNAAPDYRYLHEVSLDRPWLAKLIDQLEAEGDRRDVKVSFNRDLTNTAPEDEAQRQRFESERLKGAFYLTLTDKMTGRETHYKVFDNPPQALRKGREGEPYGTISLPFDKLVEDFLDESEQN